MHGLTGISSPDHLPPAPVTYEDDPVIDSHRTDGASDGHRVVLQPTAPSLAEILGQECDMGCSQFPGHPFSLSSAAAATRSAEPAFWWSIYQRSTHDCMRQDCIASSAAGSTGYREDALSSGSPIRFQLCTDPYPHPPPPLGVEGSQRPQSILSQVVSANSRH